MLSVPVCRFRGALLGALMGDCIGAVFEGLDAVSTTFVKRVLEGLEKDDKQGALTYTDDTAMTRSMVQSFLENKEFSVKDLADRFTKEYFNDPDRGYGAGVIHVFEKLRSGEYNNVLTPAKEQFNGKGSFGNGAAMRAVAIPLAFPNVADIIEYAKTSGKLTHASSLGYNGAILQALAVHYALHGEQSRDSFISSLLVHMVEVEADEKSRSDAVELELGEFPYCKRLTKIKEFLAKECVSREDVVEHLGHGIAALESVPTAIYSFLRCMDPVEDLPSEFNSLQRTLAYCFLLGGDTDTIATMAGAIAGAYHGELQVPQEWKLKSEGYKDAEKWAEELHQLYTSRLPC
ncbi:PREDICTED: poly(ADP-ribose) glycohydrolase ARH3 [Nanorana parkeri]|uniref:poly(ADP-ribose) glycohydrolase ARH3 n=1 Tax=Nanorana parkeri TaxID=125878 RepID=UPI00085464CB|nr:PREDICTED: poly(ADP-ribose) glycohydrolase ARH3 [Nanorana parkeri]XP_018432064.1 PREDICTED: poly(ADP-ribose) glycohydrolase ARH3 [Nanorana parkeri]